MTHKLTLFSQEIEDFVLEILIDSDAKFSELHQLILADCNYSEHDRQCFLLCDEAWHVRQRISLSEGEDVGYDEDVNLMSRTRIGDFLEDEGQRLAYVFDPEGRRFFLMELTENIFGGKETEAVVNRRHGKAPMQTLHEEEEPTKESSEKNEEIGEDFYGDDGFDDEELDMEGYGIDE